jgi:hypothetical protein
MTDGSERHHHRGATIEAAALNEVATAMEEILS